MAARDISKEKGMVLVPIWLVLVAGVIVALALTFLVVLLIRWILRLISQGNALGWTLFLFVILMALGGIAIVFASHLHSTP